MATTQDIHAPSLGAQGEPCAQCGAPLAGDQRYCLECGARRADARIAFRDILARQGGPPRAPVGRSYAEERKPPGGMTFLVGLVCLLLALGVGVLIGRSGNDTPTAAAPLAPQVISVGGAAPAAAAPAATSTGSSATTTGDSSSGSSSSSGGKSSKDAGASSTKGGSKATNKAVKQLDNSSGSD
ncbi:MAG TPA: hypothetical protein VF080_19800, partial [Solirubrobacteraceae bacterium]